MSLPPGWGRRVHRCRDCDRPILLVRLDTGNSMPVDPALDPAGTVAVRRDHTGSLVGRVLRQELPLAGFERLMMTHFATCPERQQKPSEGLPDNVVSLDRTRRGRATRPAR